MSSLTVTLDCRVSLVIFQLLPLPSLSSVGANVSSIPINCGTPFHSVSSSFSSNMSFSSVEISFEMDTNSA